MIFSLERLLSGATKLTRDCAKKLGKPPLHIYDAPKEQYSIRIRIASRFKTDEILCSNKIEILKVVGPRGIEGTRHYEWTLAMLRLFL